MSKATALSIRRVILDLSNFLSLVGSLMTTDSGRIGSEPGCLFEDGLTLVWFERRHVRLSIIRKIEGQSTFVSVPIGSPSTGFVGRT